MEQLLLFGRAPVCRHHKDGKPIKVERYDIDFRPLVSEEGYCTFCGELVWMRLRPNTIWNRSSDLQFV